MDDARAVQLLRDLDATDTAVIEDAAREMLKSDDPRFLDPLVRLLDADDIEGGHVADHVIWVVVEEGRRGSNLAAEIFLRMRDGHEWLEELRHPPPARR